jgi:hypothetical protein
LRNPHRTNDLISPFVRKSLAKIPVNEIVLYESVGGMPFPVYKPLSVFPLTGVASEVEDESFSAGSDDEATAALAPDTNEGPFEG